MTAPLLPHRYSLRSLLGEGGSGRVYRVFDSVLDRELALKIVTSSESSFLRREFDTLRQIRHENLIQVFDWGSLESGESYYTMELVEGGDWKGAMGGAAQADDEVRRVLTGVLRGLAHLHCHGEIHGDLKPENILLGPGGVVKISDVGMGGSGGSGGLSGTPGYAAPEIWEGAKGDERSDLYSVGVMAYEAITGKHPFEGRTVREVVSGQLEGWVPTPGVHGVKVPADLERVIMRAVERQPGLRQGSADEFMEGMGVEDRVGEILGGRLVGREREIGEIEALLNAREPGRPTLLHLAGEPGVGKTALVEELRHRAIASGARVLDLGTIEARDAVRNIGEAIGAKCGDAADGSTTRTSEVAEALAEQGGIQPVLIPLGSGVEDLGELNDLARYVWAISKEKNRPSRVLFIRELSAAPESASEFECGLSLAPLSGNDFIDAIFGLLGSCDLEAQLIAKLEALTGGNPGALRGGVAQLIDGRVLDRRLGVWKFREEGRIQSLQLRGLRNHWEIAWGHLSAEEQDALIALALLPRGSPAKSFASIVGGGDGIDTISRLTAKGWIRLEPGTFAIGSESARQAVLSSAEPDRCASAAKILLESSADILNREERTDLCLTYHPLLTKRDDVLWAADRAADRGDHRKAAARLRRYLSVNGNQARAGGAEISFKLAWALHRLGDHQEALTCLRESDNIRTGEDLEALSNREFLMGDIERSIGAFERARSHFRKALKMAEEAKSHDLILERRASLAELEWQHGDESSREEAIARMRSLIAEISENAQTGEQVANLTYQVGAGLVVSGRHTQATMLLSEGLARDVPRFWRMRMANALASGSFFQGLFDTALQWVNEAWRIAEESGYDAFKARILANRGAVYNGLGRPRDAADQQLLGAQWARRSGNTYEYSFSCVGAAFNLSLLARYEEALVQADESLSAAQSVRDISETAKAIELKSLILYSMGDYDGADALVARAKALIAGKGYMGVAPRLDWLQARIAGARRDYRYAEQLLRRAEGVLKSTQDWEDLPGVQIEEQLLKARLGHHEAAVREIMRIVGDSKGASAPAVQIAGAVAIGEILLSGNHDHTGVSGFLSTCLARAELAGMLEPSWYLSYVLGEVALSERDLRTAQGRFGHAVRTLREILNLLKTEHRHLYLARPHTRSAIRRLLPDSP